MGDAERDPAAERDVPALHAAVDAASARLFARHAGRLQCRRGCNGCCVDDLTVFEVEAARIRERHARLLETEAPGAPGACAFLDAAGACRIYAERPYVCRTQGLPLRWTDVADHGDGDAGGDGPLGEVVEYRDICALNEAGEPLETLPAEACWELGPVEERLALLQLRRGPSARVRLRDLFAKREA